MKQLPSVAAIYEQMDQARRAGPLLTNFYPVPDKLQRSVERGELFSINAGNVLFVLRRDRDFLHLSYVASSAAELATAVREVVASITDTVTVDLLGPRERVAEIAELCARAGFRGHCELHRMTKVRTERSPSPALPGEDKRSEGRTENEGLVLTLEQGQHQVTRPGEPFAPPEPSDPELVLAGRGDAAALVAMLETALDRYTEQIPDEDEMARAIADRKVTIIRSGRAIAGMLFSEVTGQSSLLRHWVVDPAHRDQRIGARLIRRYFADCKGVRRFLLWVISDNHNAIDRYRHYGYQQDGMIDQVLIRQAS